MTRKKLPQTYLRTRMRMMTKTLVTSQRSLQALRRIAKSRQRRRTRLFLSLMTTMRTTSKL